MLVVATADLTGVVSRGLIACSLACCGLVLASFALFALSQAAGASKAQVAQVNGRPVAIKATKVVHQPGQPRRFIDGAASALTSPFRSFIHTDSRWALEIATTLFALLLYGFGLGYLARWART
jgi:hypothetical protein